MRWLIVCLLSLLLGCSQEVKPATALVVSTMTDFAPGTELTEVWYRAFPRDADPSRDKPFADVRVPVADMHRPLVIEKGEDDEVLIAVQGLGTAEPKNAIVEHRLFARFEHGKSLEVPVFLGKACRDKACAETPGQTCYWEPSNGVGVGSCGPIPFPQMSSVLESPDDFRKWTPPDAGTMDADAGDASMCAMSIDAGTCDPIGQCGCPIGQHCTLDDENGQPFCSSTMGTEPKGARCDDAHLCKPGLGCTDSTCTNYCVKNDECGEGGACVKSTGRHYGWCLMGCGAGRPCAVGIPCTRLRNLAVPDGSYCFRPSSDCSTAKNNRTCDEPEGTGFCAEGTDPSDCVSNMNGTTTCDPITVAGCAADRTCRGSVTGNTFTTACTAFGTAPTGSLCENSLECGRGLACVSGLCKKFCNPATTTGCGTGFCGKLLGEDGKTALTIGACSVPCNFSTGAPCPTGTVCAQFGANAFACHKQPTTCPTNFQSDGECDETTRLCRVGTDVADCR
jgi:hypothetical protein